MLWMVACELLLDNIRLGRASAKEEAQQLDRFVAVMTAFGGRCPLIREQ
jgi:hypothetical protein